ncbi:MAG: Gfo/Idh/MocA family oxidoreductase [Ruminococcaceae bacterium]|nr:Gfo/Idh/MocA family oxidoreductase [Oscillospiraceae bacterium]
MKQKLSVGVIGLSMGRYHLKGLIDKGIEVAAICDVNPETLKTEQEKYNLPDEKCFTDWHELLKLEQMNTVLVITPDQLHREMSEAFLAKGKHVMCEKPLAIIREDLDAIVRAADNADAKFMVGQICRFTPAFVKAKELIDAGVIGEICFAESEYAHDYAKILHEWRADPNRHGVVGGGCHAVDLLRWLVGDPEEVFAYGSHKLLPNVTYDDATIAVLKFSCGAIGKVFVSTGCKRPYTMRTQIWGTKGTILCDNTSDTMQLWTLSEDGIAVNKTPEIIPIKVDNHNVVGEFDVFAEHILNDTPVKMSAREGAKTVATCFAIMESSKTGAPVKPNYNF